MKHGLLSLISTIVITNSPGSLAAEFEQHGAHEHGSARLNVALDGSALYLELESPAVNIVGFEHAPVKDEEKLQLDRARVQLQNPESLFLLPDNAECQLVEVDVDSSLFSGAVEHHHADSAEEHDHEKDKDKDKDKDKEKGHEDEHENDKGHADIHAVYHFECSKPQQLSHLELKLFSTFPQTRDIDAQVISPRGQTQQELSPANTKIEL
ncbi:hypothetical protein BTA51_01480 [Hahella sp. CCB-MM4]|uniref:DUF2796 domain-containing protein n=1 Tax=Hahella sp. (strain CCB-MM4) TaxID=1926491 RepID=UPI000B9C692E|nr:DUF2796 domain-containing protein [Hahella sp. CCB-MM4]OZG75093.1 hypothetical protein BTA51_01480 [Hahella sp. CCB-MM4]